MTKRFAAMLLCLMLLPVFACAEGMTQYTTGAVTYGVWSSWTHVGDSGDHPTDYFYRDSASNPFAGYIAMQVMQNDMIPAGIQQMGEEETLRVIVQGMGESLGESSVQCEYGTFAGQTGVYFSLTLYGYPVVGFGGVVGGDSVWMVMYLSDGGEAAMRDELAEIVGTVQLR